MAINSPTLTPAYGRDYQSITAVCMALAKQVDGSAKYGTGLDWSVHSLDGRSAYATARELLEMGVQTVTVRYAKLSKSVKIDLAKVLSPITEIARTCVDDE